MEAKTLPSLSALRAFHAVVRSGSVSQAARDLFVTQGAVSHQVAQLESWFGRPLLVRGARGVRATSDGEVLALAAREAFGRLEEACDLLRERGRRLEVGASASVLAHWLVPQLPSLEDALGTAARLRLSTDGCLEDLRRRRLDSVVLCVSDVSQEFRTVRIGAERIGPVHAPRGKAATRLACATRADAWREWEALSGSVASSRKGREFDHFSPMIEAAKAGLGTAIAPELLVRTAVSQGSLLAPSGFRESGRSFVLAVLAERAEERPLRILMQWAEGLKESSDI